MPCKYCGSLEHPASQHRTCATCGSHEHSTQRHESMVSPRSPSPELVSKKEPWKLKNRYA